MKKVRWLLAIVGTVLLSAAPVLADGDFYVIAGGGAAVGTKITSLPYTISTTGFYYVTGNLTCASGDGITVNVDNVTLDLMGFSLNGNNNSAGIHTWNNNVEIRNGTLQGWYNGIYGDDASAVNNRVINVRMVNITNYGIYYQNGNNNLIRGCSVSNSKSGQAGIHIGDGNGKSTVSGNQVYKCDNGIFNFGKTSNNLVSGCRIGIFGSGEICNNSIDNSGVTNAVGISWSGAPCLISGNTVGNCSLVGIAGGGTISNNSVATSSDLSISGTGISYGGGGSIIGNSVATGNDKQTGITTLGSDPVLVTQNTVWGPGTHFVAGGGTVNVANTNAGF